MLPTTQTFGLGGMLQSVAVNVRGAVTATDIVTNIDYNARGQRRAIAYGNGSTTDYEYHSKNFRVTRIHTERPHTDPDLRTVQDLRYHYDPSGNIAQIRDQAQQGVFFDNAYADPTQKFRYDPTYRLIEAHGREHATLAMQTAEGFLPIAHPQDTQTQANYVQTYRYDPVGNILRMKHVSSVAWERGYDYPTNGNRLRATSDGADDVNDPPNYSIEYQYDAHGNMIAMPNIPGGLTWDDDDRLQSSDTIGGGITYYVYDGAGQRVRKVSVNQSNSTSKQRLYFGSWETYREHKNINTTHDLDLERETLHVHDDHGRVCLIETKTVDAGSPVVTPANVARYQYSNHLGTANLELDDDAEVISYEEFHPYGTSSYRAANNAIEVSAKRYRYTGQERDEETGLAYHSARYYAPWLARWTAADPIGLTGGINRYAYVQGRPIVMHDPAGTQERAGPVSSTERRVAEIAGWTPEQLQAAQQQVVDAKDALASSTDDILADAWLVAKELPSIAVDAVKEELLGKIPGYSQVQDARDVAESAKEFHENPGVLTGASAVISAAAVTPLPLADAADTIVRRVKRLGNRIQDARSRPPRRLEHPWRSERLEWWPNSSNRR